MTYYRVTFTDRRRKQVLIKAQTWEDALSKAEKEAKQRGAVVDSVAERFTR